MPPQCSNGNPITLTAATPGGTWSGNGIVDPNLGIFNPSIAGPGNHTITYTISGACGSSSSTIITVYQSPTATAQSNSPICEGTTLQLSVNTVPNSSYQWSGPNNFSSTLQNPSIQNVNLTYNGTYTVTVTDNNQCYAISSVNVIINPSPSVTITANNPVCKGSTLNITATAGYASYSWSGPNNFHSSQNSISIPNVSLNQSGTYTVTVTNTNGCSTVESIIINVLNFNTGTITISLTTSKLS